MIIQIVLVNSAASTLARILSILQYYSYTTILNLNTVPFLNINTTQYYAVLIFGINVHSYLGGKDYIGLE